MSLLRAIIVEDEPTGLENLHRKLEQNCPEVEIVAECMNGEDAIRQIRRHLPDVLFLDIMLGDMTGFDVLKAIRQPTFEVIFTTSYDEYAIQAIKSNALDYLLKPIDIDELIEAVSKMKMKMREKNQPIVSSSPGKIGFPIATGQQFLAPDEIIYISTEDNVAILHLAERKQIKLTKSLGWVEELLTEKGFFRAHHSYVINFNHMSEYVRQDGGYIIMSDKKLISLARRRKDDFLLALEAWERK
ncbi:MAG: LytTR family DNA-binding domain-containing protein [Chitinophagales bacterium]|nr:LytTR family DNA-binding domain-containing protein [Chitinophagales bacterium]